uniref:UBC core domain-containing protein n=1 Tax=Elphidium margaritaceum TaxID=933848 RepID=A0A7S0TFC4_9EUKA|mmetsp:Transcript_131/g.198  ORF Transcript_131/g.198 Transcript_131/m.198 type:complete len:232 (+) Transcript_131:12-707(+)
MAAVALLYEFKGISKYCGELLTVGFCKQNSILFYHTDLIGVIIEYLCWEPKSWPMDTRQLNQVRQKMGKRISKEFHVMRFFMPLGIAFTVHPENFRYFLVEIKGPAGTPFENGTFYGELFLRQQYPMRPPQFRLLTKIYHPGFDKLGRHSLDVFRDKWTPALTIMKICQCIQLTIQDPNWHDPMDTNIAAVWENDRALAEKTAREWTQRYAQPYRLNVKHKALQRITEGSC